MPKSSKPIRFNRQSARFRGAAQALAQPRQSRGFPLTPPPQNVTANIMILR
jgi:hypothetical protein